MLSGRKMHIGSGMPNFSGSEKASPYCFESDGFLNLKGSGVMVALKAVRLNCHIPVAFMKTSAAAPARKSTEIRRIIARRGPLVHRCRHRRLQVGGIARKTA